MYPEDNFEFTPVDQDGFDSGAFLLGMITGAAIGAGLALLFAPQSGEEARHELTESATAFKDKVSAGYSTLTEETSNRLDVARHRVESTVEEARETVEEWISSTRDALDETRNRLDAAVEAGREAYEEKKRTLEAQVDASLDA